MSRTAGQARRLLEEKVEKVSQQLAQVPERRTLLEAPAPDMGSGVFLSLSLSFTQHQLLLPKQIICERRRRGSLGVSGSLGVTWFYCLDQRGGSGRGTNRDEIWDDLVAVVL